MTAADLAVTEPEDRVTRLPLLPPRVAGAGVGTAEGLASAPLAALAALAASS